MAPIYHKFLLRIPVELWNRMCQRFTYGQSATKFIIQAIEEKLERAIRDDEKTI